MWDGTGTKIEEGYDPDLQVGVTEKGTPIFDEERGCSLQPEFVKKNPKNNAAYVENYLKYNEQFRHIVEPAVEEMERACPGFNIVQMKEKFSSTRFYVSVPEGTDSEVAKRIFNMAREVEVACDKVRLGLN